MWLLAIFVAVPIIEIAIFIQVGGLIGLWPTLAIVLLTALAGTMLVRTQGLQTLQRLQASLETGRDPLDPIAHGALILVAGVLLLTPGFFTDAVGLALLLPPVRGALIRRGAAHVTVLAAARAESVHMRRPGAPRRPRPAGDDTIEAEYDVLDERGPRHDPSRDPEQRRGSDYGPRRGTSGWTRRD